MQYFQIPSLVLTTSCVTILFGIILFGNLSYAQQSNSSSIIADGAILEKLGEGYSFTEGPIADKKGNVFFTDQPNNKIYRWDAQTNAITLFSDQAGRANGMYFDKKGNLIACADEENQIWSFDKKGKHTVLLAKFEGKLLNGPNDLWIDSKDGIYFTDPLYERTYWKRDPTTQLDGQKLYYLPAGSKNAVVVNDEFKKPNGIIGTSDNKKLYVADIGASKIYVFDIEGPGKLTNRTIFTDMGCDGMTVDEKGNVYLAGKGVTVFDKTGKKITEIPIHKGWTSNVTFGGKNNDMLFVTAEKAVYGLKMKVRGN